MSRMSGEKFTPGPWHVENRHKPYVMQKNGIALAEVWELSVISREQADANAHLIAAAPEMYEALESVCVSCQLRDHETYCENCRYGKALRKARGESEATDA